MSLCLAACAALLCSAGASRLEDVLGDGILENHQMFRDEGGAFTLAQTSSHAFARTDHAAVLAMLPKTADEMVAFVQENPNVDIVLNAIKAVREDLRNTMEEETTGFQNQVNLAYTGCATIANNLTAEVCNPQVETLCGSYANYLEDRNAWDSARPECNDIQEDARCHVWESIEDLLTADNEFKAVQFDTDSGNMQNDLSDLVTRCQGHWSDFVGKWTEVSEGCAAVNQCREDRCTEFVDCWTDHGLANEVLPVQQSNAETTCTNLRRYDSMLVFVHCLAVQAQANLEEAQANNLPSEEITDECGTLADHWGKYALLTAQNDPNEFGQLTCYSVTEPTNPGCNEAGEWADCAAVPAGVPNNVGTSAAEVTFPNLKCDVATYPQRGEITEVISVIPGDKVAMGADAAAALSTLTAPAEASSDGSTNAA